MKRFTKNNVYENSDFLEKLIKDAGFVDVKVKYTKLCYGTWMNGKVTLDNLNTDHSLHEGGRAFTRAIAGAVEPLAKSFIDQTHFADGHSMDKFIEDAKADLMNPNYHIYGDMYISIFFYPC